MTDVVSDFSTHMAQAKAARQQGDRVAALEHFRAAAAFDPQNVSARLEIGIELRELGRLDEAATTYRDMVANNPRLMLGWRGLALVARQRGDRAQAVEHWKRALEVDPADLWLQNDLANDLRDSGRHDEAEPIFLKLSEQYPDFVGGWRGLAFIARQRSDRAQAIDHFTRAVALDPANR
ncbi:tetratricopeptide repeat protein, partial [uncultured Rhodoblastus sp.]|uniref:tetratricopeptide repeat protein n=1 Tax=uncultured Rhodoblastus sp. TaxID=543037 RepID=UPI0025F5CADE